MTANDQAAKNGKPMTKSAFVRQFPDSMPPREIVAKAKEQGIEISAAVVSALRSTLKTRAAKKAATQAAPPPVKRGPGRPRKTVAAPVAGTNAAPAGDADRQFLTLVLELGLRRSEDLLTSVKARAASLA